MSSFFDDFKKFAMRGNVVDMAVGVIIGASFGKIVSSFVSDILMPPLGLLLGRVDFSNLFINLSGTPVRTLAEAQAANVPVISYGVFLNTVIDFLIQAFVIFVMVRQMSKLIPDPPAAPEPKPQKECPYCMSSIDARATKCPDCTADLPAGEAKPA